jgi:acyl-homoserine lactone acylase PvdQ
VGVADFDPSRPFAVRRASSYRMAIDLAIPDRMLTSLAPGQSEQRGRPHYDDGLQPWLSGRARLLAMSRFLVEEQGGERLVLEPAR